MSEILLIVAGLFLPLFPLSMVFTGLFNRLGNRNARTVLLLVWPQIGLFIVSALGVEIPGWIIVWALLTAILYGFRALVLREVSLWISFLAASLWAVLWLVIGVNEASWSELMWFGLGFSVPFVLLLLLGGELESRFGAAYTGLYNGLAQALPRLSWLIAIVVLAIIATPLFPSFSVLMTAMLNVADDSFVLALMLAVAWFTWGWAGTRLIQGLLIGEEREMAVVDVSAGRAWIYAVILGVLIYVGVWMIGGLA